MIYEYVSSYQNEKIKIAKRVKHAHIKADWGRERYFSEPPTTESLNYYNW